MRGPLAGLIALVACLVLPLALVSAWTAARVTDTEGYVAATAPLASDPVVRREVSARLVALVEQSVPGDPEDLFPGAGALGNTVVEQAVAGALRSELFARTWVAANRAAHAQVLAGLRGDGGTGRVTLDLAPVLRTVVDELVGDGLPVADVPLARTRITLVAAPQLAPVQRAYRVLDAVGLRGVVAWGVLVALALLVSPARRRTTSVLAWGSLVTAGGALVALVLGREAGLSAVARPERALVATVVDVLTDSLYRGLVVTVLVSVVLGAAMVLLRLVPARR